MKCGPPKIEKKQREVSISHFQFNSFKDHSSTLLFFHSQYFCVWPYHTHIACLLLVMNSTHLSILGHLSPPNIEKTISNNLFLKDSSWFFCSHLEFESIVLISIKTFFITVLSHRYRFQNQFIVFIRLGFRLLAQNIKLTRLGLEESITISTTKLLRLRPITFYIL